MTRTRKTGLSKKDGPGGKGKHKNLLKNFLKTIKYLAAIICLLLLVIIFCGISIHGKIFTPDQLPLNFMSAFLGAIITAVITLILLKGQSAAEESRDKNFRIFKKKSSLFENFNKKLNRIIDKKELSANDYNKIKSEYYTKLMLYLKKDSQLEINKYLSNLGDYIGISLHDGISRMKDVSKCYEIIRENIYNIINVLAEDLGLAGKIDISILKELDNKTIPDLLKELLLDKVNKIFCNEKIFNKARYMVMANGTFLVLNLNGQLTTGGGLHIGPFYNLTANERFPAYDGLYFRFFRPVFNPMSELYAVNDGTNRDNTLIDFKDSEKGLIDIQKPLNIESDVYNAELPIIRFDDINTIENYIGVYIDIAEAIACRAFFYYLNARTKRDNLSIKELFEKFESIPIEQFNEYVIKTITTPKDFSK